MKWEHLLPPLKRAVHDLLMRIAGAERDRRVRRHTQEQKEVSSCFLVCGSRGTGKTTVLLSAKEAICKNEGFFKVSTSDNILNEAQEWAKQLKTEIVWLDPLDLEPLPPATNLLTNLLTQVRNALDGHEPNQIGSTSIFEESATDPRQKLSELINDATLMWEEIQEADTRNKANRQRAAAEIYATFRQRFKEGMDALSKKLALRHGDNEGCSIVLPIDNIDRSPDHLKAIIKLAQMVSHPCLWLVMAGDREEVETFLERAYWKELIYSQAGVDARGKIGHGGEDETLAMARRQSTAAAAKVWPPSHRVEIDFVQPKDTLDFKPPPTRLRFVSF